MTAMGAALIGIRTARREYASQRRVARAAAARHAKALTLVILRGVLQFAGLGSVVAAAWGVDYRLGLLTLCPALFVAEFLLGSDRPDA